MAWTSQSVPSDFPVDRAKCADWKGRESSFRYKVRQALRVYPIGLKNQLKALELWLKTYFGRCSLSQYFDEISTLAEIWC